MVERSEQLRVTSWTDRANEPCGARGRIGQSGGELFLSCSSVL
ncbi:MULTISPECIES: hypothetical protein [Frankia]|jgi:hypothetical protein|nr:MULTISPECIES: hypothetical protein [Frankia]